MSEVTIREAAEAGAVRAFLDKEWERIETEPWRTARVTFVAKHEGQIIGAATGNCDAGVAHLSELMVAVGERNAGIGEQLLAAFEAWAAAQGAHKFTLHTHRDRPAVRFYKWHGWRTAYVMEDHYQHRTSLLMTKAVAGGAG